MDRETKKQLVEELRGGLGQAPVAVLCDFRGVKVEEVNRLRAEFHKEGVSYRVVKNTLTKLALTGTPMGEALSPYLRGPTAVAFAVEDPVAPARILSKMAKEIPAIKIKGGYLDGQALDVAGVEQLASMPSKDEQRAMFLSVLQAPATKMVRVLSEGIGQIVRVLEARRRALAGEG